MRPRAKALVMAGGRGERFWPASTQAHPKQFIDLTGSGTLIQQTVLRLAQIFPLRDIYVATGHDHLDLARTQLPYLPERNFLVEPVGRNTAPCIGLAAVMLEKVDPDCVMLVVPADHYIPDVDRFCQTIEVAIELAAEGQHLVTLGIQPDRPDTAYGYIEVGEPVGASAHRVLRFVEKPDKARAEDYLASGAFLWNAGMFAWSLRTIRQEIALHLPELHAGLERLASAESLDEALPRIFPTLPAISIDYGVMERSDRSLVVPADFRWDDLGSWTAIARLRTPDQDGNVTKGLVLTEESQNILVESQGRLVATLGVSDLIVVETDQAVLVCAKEKAQDIRRLAAKVQEIINAGRPQP